MVVTTGPLRVRSLDPDGYLTGEWTELDVFDVTLTDVPQDNDDDLVVFNPQKEITFTMELCWAPGGRRELIEVVAGVDFWKKSERIRRRDARRARKTRKRQR